MTARMARSPILLTGLAAGVVMGAATLAGGGSPVQALLTLVIVLGYAAAVTLLARRSETAGALAGRPVDERWEHINLEACAWALGITAVVVLVLFAVAEATGGQWQPYALLSVVMALAYVGSLLVLRARH